MSVVYGTISPVTSFEGLVVRLDPNNTQASYLAGCAGAYRKAYNYAVEQLRTNTEDYRYLRDAGAPNDTLPKPLTARDVQDSWHRGKDAHAPWHREYPSKVYLFALQAAHRAHRNWMTGKAGFPRFQTKHGPTKFKVCESIHLQARHLALPKLGPVKIYRPDPAQARLRRHLRRGKARIVSASLWRTPAGIWHASLTIERDTARTRPADHTAPTGVVGVDLGVKTRAVAADPTGSVVVHVTGTNPLRDQARKLRRAQRVLSRKDHGPRRRDRCRPSPTVTVPAAGEGPTPGRPHARRRRQHPRDRDPPAHRPTRRPRCLRGRRGPRGARHACPWRGPKERPEPGRA